MSGSAAPGFLRALGLSCGIVVALGLAAAIPARLLADVPPEIDGEGVFVAFELKWPASETIDPRTLPGEPLATLGSVVMHTQRKSEDGPLFVADARQDAGRWVVPGAVRIFTGRGDRSLDAHIGDKQLGGFILPMKRPTGTFREWSEWLPRARDGAAPLPDGFRYRFKVVKESEPLRVQHAGPFDVATMSSYFFSTADNPHLASYSHFAIAWKGKPVDGLQRAMYVGVIPGNVPALVVHDGASDQSGTCLLVVERGAQLERIPAGNCMAPIVPRLLTRDTAAFARQVATPPTRGWLDVTSLTHPGLYRVDNAVIDTRTMTVSPFQLPNEPYPQGNPGLIGLAPDEKSVVYFAFDGGEDHPVLGVYNFRDSRAYSIAIDRSRMRYNDYNKLDPAWVDHHFTWVREASGSDSLVERPNFVPLPHRGDLQLGRPGDYAGYYLKPGSLELRGAITDFLVNEVGGTRLPDELDGHNFVVGFGDKRVDLSWVESGDFVSISMYKADEALMRRIAEAVDNVLATGRYDALFGKKD